MFYNSQQRVGNTLLHNLIEDEYKHLSQYFQETELSLGASLYDEDPSNEYVYFPTEGIISLLIILEDVKTNEIAVVGHESMVGPPLFMHGIPSTGQAVVQSSGVAIKVHHKTLM